MRNNIGVVHFSVMQDAFRHKLGSYCAVASLRSFDTYSCSHNNSFHNIDKSLSRSSFPSPSHSCVDTRAELKDTGE